MDFLDSFIITQQSAVYLSGLWVLLFGALVNFAFCGLLGKKSQKISNIITIGTLILSSALIKPVMIGFLNPHGLRALNYFDSRIILDGANIQYCLIANMAILVAFLISLKHLEGLRHKAHYFNTLYLTSALGANLLFLSKDYLTFILSLEIISVSFLFILCGFKNKNILFLGIKYYLFSFFASAVMLFAYALSNGFSATGDMLLSISKVIFISGFLLKGGFFILFAQQRQHSHAYNYPSFVFINTALLSIYSLGILKIVQNLVSIGSIIQWLFITLFAIFMPLCAIKMLRAKDFETFVFQISSLNFCFFALSFFMLTKEVNASGVFALYVTLISIFAILSAGAIFNYNHKEKYLLSDFKGICLTNPAYCAGLSTALFISAGIIPSGIACSRVFSAYTIAQNGLWTTIVLFLVAGAYTIALLSIINFSRIIHLKPSCVKDLREIALKKRTKLNYFILFVSTIVLILLCLFSYEFIKLTIDFQQIPHFF